MGFLGFVTIIFLISYFIAKIRYEKTEYYLQTKNTLGNVLLDKGQSGEFYTYKSLKTFAGYKRFLFNVYLPKENGETTEIDIILLHESGIHVFESKNYSGWIFGTETQKYWTQTLPAGRGKTKKSRFFNPIMQNEGHLKWLQQFLGHEQDVPFYSYIVFSERCTLKNVTLTSGSHYVINRYDVLNAVQRNSANARVRLTSNEIDNLYAKLYPLTQVNEGQKLVHIERIQQKQQPVEYTVGMKCPRCEGVLVMRTAIKGNHQGQKFLGCSSYPKCKFTAKIAEK